MKNKFREFVPAFIIIYCLVIIPIILYKYNLYLAKPDYSVWDQVKNYLSDSKIYNKEPLVFKPSWLKNYATDYGRFQKYNIAKSYNNFNNYWLITTTEKSLPKNYETITTKKIKNLFMFKLRKLND